MLRVVILLAWTFPVLSFVSPTAAEPSSHSIQPNLLTNKSYAEVYTFSVHGDDGTFVQVQFTITNLGVESGNAACNALAIFPSNQSWKASEKFSRKQWSYADSPSQKLAVGSNLVCVARGVTTMHFAYSGARIDLELPSAPATLSAPDIDSPKNASGKFYDYRILVPWSRAQATIVVPGGTVRSFAGFATLDRARSVGTTRDFSRGWVTFRGHKGQSFFLADLRLPPAPNAPALGWTWKTGDAKPVAAVGSEIRTESTDNAGKSKPRFVICDANHTFTITSAEELCRYSFVDDLGSFTGYLVKALVGKPVTTYHRASAQTSDGKTVVPGILEIMNIE